MPTRVEADVEVQRFAFAAEDAGKRLLFPHAQTHRIEGKSGGTSYGATECAFESLEGRLDQLRWEAASASLGAAWLRDDGGRISVAADRLELPHGLRLVRADRGLELLSPHVSFSELRLTVRGPFSRAAPATATEAPRAPGLRQERLRFLDSLSGRIYLTILVQLDLPVIGMRTLNQQLRVPIQEGSLDYRQLENSLDWLEGAVLDLEHEGDRLRVRWKVPIVGTHHDLITWALDNEASTLASFGRVPVRSLADFHVSAGGAPKPEDKKRKILKAFTLDAIDVAASLLAPRHLELAGGMILFGGDDQPGMLDLKVSGAIRNRGPGALRGAVGSIDTTIKDLRIGPVVLTTDRMHFDGLDELEVQFDGFRPVAVTLVGHRVTATNLVLQIQRGS
jgi:hypothetical protein